MVQNNVRAHESGPAKQEVIITDIHMRFGSMVVFMVKWAIAAIPAFVLLVLIGAVCWGVTTGLLRSFGQSKEERSSSQSVSDVETAEKQTSPAADNDSEAKAYRTKVVVSNIRVGKSVLGETGVFGEIKNVGTRTLKKVELTIYAMDKIGKPIFEKTYPPVSDMGYGDSAEPLKPGYSRQFGVKFDDAPSEWNGTVRFEVTDIAFQ